MEEEDKAQPIALSELITYLTEAKQSSEGPAVFRLADLVNLYKQHLKQFGVKVPNVNATRLKEQIVQELPDLEMCKKGRDVLLVFQGNVDMALEFEFTENADALQKLQRF